MKSMSRLGACAFIGAAIMLSGCVSAPPGTKEEKYTHRAVSGKKTALGMVASQKADCTFNSYPYAALVKPPSHGKVTFEHGIVRVKYDKDSIVYICSGKPVQGTTIYYTSDPGYSGPDQFIVRMTVLGAGRVSDAAEIVQVVR